MFGLMGVARMAGQPGGAWSPLSLFAASEQGAWYDPSDFSSMFQDSTGTTPVTAVEQPVGLILDKRLGLALGSELVTDPLAGSASGTWAVSAVSVTRNGSSGGSVTASVTSNNLLSSKTYLITLTVADFSGDAFFFRAGNSGVIGPISANGTYSYRVPGGGAGGLIFAPWAGAPGEATITNISVREIAGNHATQPTAAARPVVSARVNLLTYTEDFSNAAWAVQGATKTPGVTDSNGGSTAVRVAITANVGINLHYAFASTSALAYVGSCMVKGTAGERVFFGVDDTADQSLITFTGDWQQITCSIANTGGSTAWFNFEIFNRAGGAHLTAVTFDMCFPQLETGSTATRYQRVTTASDYDTVGFPHYLVFDGVDDSLANLTLPYSAARTALGAVLSTDTGSANRIFAADTYESVFNNTVDWGYYATSTSSIVAVAPGSRVAANVVGYEKPDNSSANTVNGLSIATAFVPYATTPDGYILASEAPVGGNRCAGRIYGLVVTNYMQTEAQRQALARYLADKAGITL